MAGREGGEGDVGESHGNSEEERTTSYGLPDTNGIRPTTVLIMFRHYFVYLYISVFLYHLFGFQDARNDNNIAQGTVPRARNNTHAQLNSAHVRIL